MCRHVTRAWRAVRLTDRHQCCDFQGDNVAPVALVLRFGFCAGSDVARGPRSWEAGCSRTRRVLGLVQASETWTLKAEARRVDSGLASPNLLRVPGLAVGRCCGMAVLVAVPHTRQALREAVSVRLGCPVCGQAAASSRAVHLSPSEAAPCTSLACRHHCDCTRSGAESRASCWKRWGLAHLCGLLLGKEFTAGLKG